jgi:hypothetical protein
VARSEAAADRAAVDSALEAMQLGELEDRQISVSQAASSNVYVLLAHLQSSLKFF